MPLKQTMASSALEEHHLEEAVCLREMPASRSFHLRPQDGHRPQSSTRPALHQLQLKTIAQKHAREQQTYIVQKPSLMAYGESRRKTIQVVR